MKLNKEVKEIKKCIYCGKPKDWDKKLKRQKCGAMLRLCEYDKK